MILLNEDCMCAVSQFLGTAEVFHASVVSTSMRRVLQTHVVSLSLRRQKQLTSQSALSATKSLSQFAHLRKLDLQNCRRLGDSALGNLFSGDVNIDGLLSLDLSRCSRVTDRGLEQATTKLASLESITLDGCAKVTDKSLVLMGARCRALRDVSFAYCRSIDFGAAASSCPPMDMRFCDLSFTPLKDQTIYGISQSSLNLETLICSNCYELTDAVFEYLSSMRRLRKVNFRGCNMLSDDGVEVLVDDRDAIVNLEDLDLSLCPLVSQITLQALKDNRPRVTFPKEERPTADSIEFTPLNIIFSVASHVPAEA